jgi:hypothetical protein
MLATIASAHTTRRIHNYELGHSDLLDAAPVSHRAKTTRVVFKFVDDERNRAAVAHRREGQPCVGPSKGVVVIESHPVERPRARESAIHLAQSDC